ncbi:SDR family oxidoreductase [Methylocaldum sp.]|uniref:SDR family oxidoreductase n=1 Tax=Methylocaldum sp. TaxID=1969727 RepID=UPI002D38E8E0|nr:SDR family oxidoreductase [Methylocaldum sp.]HYE34246.1 SDR family oxidoreductase [Methylocaldum sp.]
MRLNISDSVIVITGASSGIGRATAMKAAEQNGTVVLAARQADVLHEVARECEQIGGRALPMKTDVTDEEQVRQLARRAIETYGRIDAWVNDAAVTMLSRFEDAPADAFRRVIETNFFGYVHGARAVLPYFHRQGHGVLVNVGSVVGKVAAPYASAYVASKFAITGFSESLRMELRDTPDIHVCTILPATIDTPLFQHAANYSGKVVQAMPPVYAPEDVAEAILHTIHHPKREVTVGNARRMIAMRNLVPPLAERMVAKKVERRHFQAGPGTNSPGNLFEPMPEFDTVHGGWLEPRQSHRKVAWTAGTLALLAGIGAALYLSSSRRPTSRLRETTSALPDLEP